MKENLIRLNFFMLLYLISFIRPLPIIVQSLLFYFYQTYVFIHELYMLFSAFVHAHMYLIDIGILRGAKIRKDTTCSYCITFPASCLDWSPLREKSSPRERFYQDPWRSGCPSQGCPPYYNLQPSNLLLRLVICNSTCL